MTNKILSFCLGEENGTPILCETREEFLLLNKIKLVDQLEDNGVPTSPDWRISPSHLLKELDKNWDCWDMFLLTIPALNF